MDDGDTPTRTEVQADNHKRERDCDRCGRDRPRDSGRFTVTVSDFSESTAAYERAFLCVECWRKFRDHLRRSVA